MRPLIISPSEFCSYHGRLGSNAPVRSSTVKQMTSPGDGLGEVGLAGGDAAGEEAAGGEELGVEQGSGKIQQWFTRGDGRGVIFLLNCKDMEEARALIESLPLSKENLMDEQFIPVGLLLPLGILLRDIRHTGSNRELLPTSRLLVTNPLPCTSHCD
jgi:hypothetical protein